MLPEPQPGACKMPLEVALPEEGLHKMGCECMRVSTCKCLCVCVGGKSEGPGYLGTNLY